MKKPAETLHLTMAEVVKNARIAYNAGFLQAQRPDDSRGRCTYSGPCAIGVSLPKNLRVAFDNPGIWEDSTSITSIARQDGVSFPNSEELADAKMLQDSHDDWVFGLRSSPHSAESAENDFVKMLVELEGKYE